MSARMTITFDLADVGRMHGRGRVAPAVLGFNGVEILPARDDQYVTVDVGNATIQFGFAALDEVRSFADRLVAEAVQAAADLDRERRTRGGA